MIIAAALGAGLSACGNLDSEKPCNIPEDVYSIELLGEDGDPLTKSDAGDIRTFNYKQTKTLKAVLKKNGDTVPWEDSWQWKWGEVDVLSDISKTADQFVGTGKKYTDSDHSKDCEVTCTYPGAEKASETITIKVNQYKYGITLTFNPKPGFLRNKLGAPSVNRYIQFVQSVCIWDSMGNKLGNGTFADFYVWIPGWEQFTRVNSPHDSGTKNVSVRTVSGSNIVEGRDVYVGLLKTYHSVYVDDANYTAVWPSSVNQDPDSQNVTVSLEDCNHTCSAVSTSQSNPYGYSSSDFQAVYKVSNVTSDVTVKVTKGTDS